MPRRHQNHPEPSDVFTPSSLPLRENNVYSRRPGAERDLQRAATRKQVAIVFGDFGVGKTTLVQRFFQTAKDEGRLIYIPSAAELTLEAIFRRILEVLDYSVEADRTRTTQWAGQGGVDFRILTATANRTVTDESHRQLVITSPSDVQMLQMMDGARLVLVIDEMHKASRAFRDQLANLIKSVKSADFDYPTIVLIGTTLDAERLVDRDPGIDRHVVEIQVPLMTANEARFIVTEGYRRLALRISNDLADRVVESAAGAPTIVHCLCLDAAEAALSAGRTEIVEEDCLYAVKSYIQDHGRRLASAYMKVIETTGPKRYRKRILHAVADVDSDYATMEDIRRRVADALGESTRSTALSGPLRALKSAECGAILQDVERLVSGQRVHNLTTFTDPMMKSFIRFMGKVDVMRLMPASAELQLANGDAREEDVGPPLTD
jgi:type II secretory pathway predicted ATPase ExeA